jgi:hypothetical protein
MLLRRVVLATRPTPIPTPIPIPTASSARGHVAYDSSATLRMPHDHRWWTPPCVRACAYALVGGGARARKSQHAQKSMSIESMSIAHGLLCVRASERACVCACVRASSSTRACKGWPTPVGFQAFPYGSAINGLKLNSNNSRSRPPPSPEGRPGSTIIK